MTKATEEHIALVLERLEERLARPAAAAVVSSMSVMDRVWTAAPVVILAATLLVSSNSRLLTGESALDRRLVLIEADATRREKADVIREREVRLQQQYNMNLHLWFADHGIKGVPVPPQPLKEE